MLIKFRVRNFKSFKDMQELNMVASKVKSFDERIAKYKDVSLTKFAAIFGSNGAGKSNLIEAIGIMQYLVLFKQFELLKSYYFKLEEVCRNESTYFEVILKIGEDVFSYGFEFSFLKNTFTSEWLDKIVNNKFIAIFERDISNKTFVVKEGLDRETKLLIKSYLNDFKENDFKLFLSSINEMKSELILSNVTALKDIYDWFAFSLSVAKPDSILTSGDYFLIDNKLDQLKKLLEVMQTGVKNIEKVPISEEEFVTNVPSKIVNQIFNSTLLNLYENTKFGFLLRSKNNLYQVLSIDNKFTFYKICFYHDVNKKYSFSLGEESSGTIRLIDLAEILLTDKSDKVFVLDELDRAFHPQVTCEFIKLYLKECETKNIQLIATTHESRLLNLDLLRRDEIWFIDKKRNGESTLYSLEEFNVRFDKKIDKAYLEGRYGASPVFYNEI